jgi:hypothetical protein
VRSLTVWLTPFTVLQNLEDAIGQVQASAVLVNASPNLLLPTHFGQWPQAQCRQTLPADMRVGSPADIAPIRARVEAAGVGFGAWGVPVDLSSPELASAFAVASGYYVANFEPDAFWTPADDPAAVDEWWSTFWNAMPDQAPMSGNVAATVVPDRWGLDAFKESLPNLAAGCGALTLEVYGGLQTAAEYPYPNLWPSDGFAEIRARGVDANLIPIVARANLQQQMRQANRLGHGNVHTWCA